MWRCRKISIRGERGEWLMMPEAHEGERPEDAAERAWPSCSTTRATGTGAHRCG